ncbi:MAG: acetyl-CoA C-acetyltransferase [Actinobacteria bacterium]|nr:acetyl-CoA C-acetyltransferase [Actinomycetota bacterium]
MASTPRKAAVLAANRIPFARANGAYRRASNADMLGAALDGLVARTGLQGERLGEVAGGAVLKHARDFNLTREVVLGSKLAADTPAFDLQQACATGLEATVAIANKIALRQLDSGVAAGVDTVSDAPVALNDDLRRLLMDANAAGGPLEVAALLPRLRPHHLVPEIPKNAEPRTGLSMGEHAAITTREWEISRDQQDRLALASHQQLAAAYDRGFFDDLLTPYLGLQRDDNLRADTSLEKLSQLEPAFGTGEGATMTPGNSTPLTDGAPTVLLGSEEWGRAHGLAPLAFVVDAEIAAVDYVHGHEGLLMAPVYAVPRLLARRDLSLEDFDFYEFHEAFASTVLATLKAWEDPAYCKERLGLDGPLGTVDRTRLNVVGSSLATGHPFAATGARIVATAAKLLHEKGSGRALISICAAGGNGLVAILER